MEYLFIYFLVINLIGFGMMYSDKKRAIKKKYRIPEKTLFLVALVGGSLGTTLGMETFRHKTKHWYFKWGMPAIFVLQIIILGLVMKYK
ncbi:DUF1294 domain-containing protein [Niameybacter massiliensis]|uniref:DUF1294 domain-containing protein n=1 Tax=Holtiella tumoricola TaxID=3018743 RepID=A0AA42DQH6_9FIRM|nr:DUF1294 domain-containing protein [Niameybacter massiliensis]MDA3733448.1 DUF1294 domain-containing protein [Holtiella tumoricola]